MERNKKEFNIQQDGLPQTADTVEEFYKQKEKDPGLKMEEMFAAARADMASLSGNINAMHASYLRMLREEANHVAATPRKNDENEK